MVVEGHAAEGSVAGGVARVAAAHELRADVATGVAAESRGAGRDHSVVRGRCSVRAELVATKV